MTKQQVAIIFTQNAVRFGGDLKPLACSQLCMNGSSKKFQTFSCPASHMVILGIKSPLKTTWWEAISSHDFSVPNLPLTDWI